VVSAAIELYQDRDFDQAHAAVGDPAAKRNSPPAGQIHQEERGKTILLRDKTYAEQVIQDAVAQGDQIDRATGRSITSRTIARQPGRHAGDHKGRRGGERRPFDLLNGDHRQAVGVPDDPYHISEYPANPVRRWREFYQEPRIQRVAADDRIAFTGQNPADPGVVHPGAKAYIDLGVSLHVDRGGGRSQCGGGRGGANGHCRRGHCRRDDRG